MPIDAPDVEAPIIETHRSPSLRPRAIGTHPYSPTGIGWELNVIMLCLMITVMQCDLDVIMHFIVIGMMPSGVSWMLFLVTIIMKPWQTLSDVILMLCFFQSLQWHITSAVSLTGKQLYVNCVGRNGCLIFGCGGLRWRRQVSRFVGKDGYLR